MFASSFHDKILPTNAVLAILVKHQLINVSENNHNNLFYTVYLS